MSQWYCEYCRETSSTLESPFPLNDESRDQIGKATAWLVTGRTLHSYRSRRHATGENFLTRRYGTAANPAMSNASIHLEATSMKTRTWPLPNGFGLAAVLAKVSMKMPAIGGWGSLRRMKRISNWYCCVLDFGWMREASVKKGGK